MRVPKAAHTSSAANEEALSYLMALLKAGLAADVIRIAIAFDAGLVSTRGRVRVVMARAASGATSLTSSSAGAAATTPLIHASDVAHRPQERIVDVIAIGLAKADGKLGQDGRMASCQKGTSDRIIGAWCFVQRRIGGKSR
jgi:hypothetical protein